MPSPTACSFEFMPPWVRPIQARLRPPLPGLTPCVALSGASHQSSGFPLLRWTGSISGWRGSSKTLAKTCSQTSARTGCRVSCTGHSPEERHTSVAHCESRRLSRSKPDGRQPADGQAIWEITGEDEPSTYPSTKKDHSSSSVFPGLIQKNAKRSIGPEPSFFPSNPADGNSIKPRASILAIYCVGSG